ncbi:DNA helicase [Lentibacillus sp. JNUCC-1]|uniref:ATP-dependent DNA helicase DinG n=1 Tax=Lentibacillus sp. JNUCC-1 TaxID=2654513 RepID=UPI0012E6F8D0|nr:ATP-dependent DNA helicase DinG [Lentibacillus sp. JNUCC-1]MUV39797.1 DNA helicase [Lentibacillus sp. JNUCC-1]
MTKYAVIDLETTGHSPAKNDKIIEIGLVIVEDNQILETYSTFINPQIPIPSFISTLTGIKDTDVATAPLFSEVAGHLSQLVSDCYLAAHNADFDIGFLNAAFDLENMPKLENPVIDTVELARILYPSAPAFKLGYLAEYLELDHSDPHRALSDALVTAKMLMKMTAKIEILPLETIIHLQTLENKLKSNIKHLLSEREEASLLSPVSSDSIDTFRGLAYRRVPDNPEKNTPFLSSFGHLLDEVYEDGGRLSELFSGRYEKRPGQRHMSEVVFDAFQSNKHALIEAETGTGKSLAYLIPAVYEALKASERVVISTHTTQLQAQLLDEEIPLVQRVMPFPFQAALLKGKRHYISLERFQHELYTSEDDHYGVTLTKAMLLVWLTETETGDIDEVSLPSSGYLFYHKVSAEGEDFSQSDPAWFGRSYYQKARKRAQSAHIIITNHALLCTDLFSDSNFIPAYDRVIIDEAHHLEDTVANHYGLKLDYQNIQYNLNQIGSTQEGGWMNRVMGQMGDMAPLFLEAQWHEALISSKKEIDECFNQIFQYVKLKQKKSNTKSDIGRVQHRISPEDVNGESRWSIIVEMTARVTFYLRDLIHMLTLLKQTLKEEKSDSVLLEEADNHIERIQDIIDNIETLFLVEQKNVVKWIEIDPAGSKNTVYVYSEPLEVSQVLEGTFFDKKKSIVMTSATLTIRDSFTFIVDRLGIPESVMKEQIKSPFNYEEQVRLMIPNDFPDIKHGNMNDFIYSTCEAILSLAEVTHGRMLILFTSYDMLKKTHAMLKETLDTNRYALFAQGITSGSRTRLKKNFQTFDQAILLGTSSFWEGVDIPGDDLSCLMIVRLPFYPPGQPVYEARAEAIKARGKNAFMDLALPQAVIRFKQGFGRLIRSTQDRGIVFVCDTRIVKSRYGRYFTQSIPHVPIMHASMTDLVEEASEWF